MAKILSQPENHQITSALRCLGKKGLEKYISPSREHRATTTTKKMEGRRTPLPQQNQSVSDKGL